jgi:hypothetical protein
MSSSSTHTPRRLPASNDGRSTNPRRLNVEFGMSSSPSLPPSTGTGRSINFDRLQSGYQIIASSLSDLARQQSVRGSNVINEDIIATYTKKFELEREGVDGVLIQAYDQKIKDLQTERDQSVWLRSRMFAECDNDQMTNAPVSLEVPIIDSNSEQSEVEQSRRRIRRRRTAD